MSRILGLCCNTRGNGNGKRQSRNNPNLADSTIIVRCTIVFRLRHFLQEVYKWIVKNMSPIN
jgi:hypothetical protein